MTIGREQFSEIAGRPELVEALSLAAHSAVKELWAA